jgi:hypothetical protein
MSSAQAKHPDEELLAYGRDLDSCIHDYKIAHAKFRPLWDRLDERLDAERPAENESFVDWHHRLCDEIGLSALEDKHEHPDDPTNRSDAPSRAILAIPATTLTGLAVKARLARFGASHIWDKSDDDADWDHLVLRKLVDAVLDLAATNTSEVGGAA